MSDSDIIPWVIGNSGHCVNVKIILRDLPDFGIVTRIVILTQRILTDDTTLFPIIHVVAPALVVEKSLGSTRILRITLSVRVPRSI